MSPTVIFEACVDSVEGALAARQGGADRLELCANLLEGGVTPSAGMIESVGLQVDIPVHVLIRPRAADCCYSEAELQVMECDIEHARLLGAAAVVLGVLCPDGSIDRRRTQRLAEAARPLPVTFHRAFDMTSAPYAALEDLLELGIERVLTSGQEQTALEGVELIAELVRRAGDHLEVVAAGGVTERNVGRVVAQTRVRAVHATLRAGLSSQMEYHHPHCSMGGALRPAEFGWSATSASRVQALVEVVRGRGEKRS